MPGKVQVSNARCVSVSFELKLRKAYHGVNDAFKQTSSGYLALPYDIRNPDHKLPSNSFPTSLINASFGNASFFDNTVP